MSNDRNPSREEMAIDALITGALHAWSPKDVSEAEVNEFLSSSVELTASENAALKRVRKQFLAGLETVDATDGFVGQQAMEPPYMAMNRENAKDQIPEAAREELERKRAALLAELKAKKRPSG